MPARQMGTLKGDARERESVHSCVAAMSSGTLLAARLNSGEVRPPRVRQQAPRVARDRTKKEEEAVNLEAVVPREAHIKK